MHIDRMIYGMIFGFALFVPCYFLFFKKRIQSTAKKIYTALLFTYVGALIFLTMLFAPPWSWDISSDGTWWCISRINLEPIESSLEIYKNCEMYGDFKSFYVLIGGNLALLMPLGILLPLINKKIKLVWITLISMGVAFSIEALQLLNNILLGSPLRTVEIDDFILNSAGCIIAYLIFAVFRFIFKSLYKKIATH